MNRLKIMKWIQKYTIKYKYTLNFFWGQIKRNKRMKAGITLGFKPKESDLTAISMLSLSSPSAASTVIFYLYYCTSQRPAVMVMYV